MVIVRQYSCSSHSAPLRSNMANAFLSREFLRAISPHLRRSITATTGTRHSSAVPAPRTTLSAPIDIRWNQGPAVTVRPWRYDNP